MNKKLKAIGKAERFLLDIPFGEWVAFNDIPDGLFDEVFELIEERFNGLDYIFDDFDLMFKKQIPKTFTGMIRAHAKVVTKIIYEKEMFKTGE